MTRKDGAATWDRGRFRSQFQDHYPLKKDVLTLYEVVTNQASYCLNVGSLFCCSLISLVLFIVIPEYIVVEINITRIQRKNIAMWAFLCSSEPGHQSVLLLSETLETEETQRDTLITSKSNFKP